jgi:hypothetical protein
MHISYLLFSIINIIRLNLIKQGLLALLHSIHKAKARDKQGLALVLALACLAS